MKRLSIPVIVLAGLTASCGCGPNVVDVSITDSPVRIEPQVPFEIQCDPPLKRIRNSASILVELDQEWHPETPWDHIVVDGVGDVTVSATLVATSGDTFTSSIAGMAGGLLNLRFDPEVPIDTEFGSIRFESSDPLRFKNVVWHLYNPK